MRDINILYDGDFSNDNGVIYFKLVVSINNQG